MTTPKYRRQRQACDWLVTGSVAAVHYTIGWRKLERWGAGCSVGMVGHIKGLSCCSTGSTGDVLALSSQSISLRKVHKSQFMLPESANNI